MFDGYLYNLDKFFHHRRIIYLLSDITRDTDKQISTKKKVKKERNWGLKQGRVKLGYALVIC